MLSRVKMLSYPAEKETNRHGVDTGQNITPPTCGGNNKITIRWYLLKVRLGLVDPTAANTTQRRMYSLASHTTWTFGVLLSTLNVDPRIRKIVNDQVLIYLQSSQMCFAHFKRRQIWRFDEMLRVHYTVHYGPYTCTSFGGVFCTPLLFHIAPETGAKYCDQRVCLSVCSSVRPSVCLSQAKIGFQTLPDFRCMLPGGVA